MWYYGKDKVPQPQRLCAQQRCGWRQRIRVDVLKYSTEHSRAETLKLRRRGSVKSGKERAELARFAIVRSVSVKAGNDVGAKSQKAISCGVGHSGCAVLGLT